MVSEDEKKIVYQWFPKLRKRRHEFTSVRTVSYNCIAWAASEQHRVWWPSIMPGAYWPRAAPRVETIEAFVAAFATIGYQSCEGDSLEQGFEKVAIFAKDGKPTHAARQLSDGIWTSKLGKSVDVSHALGGLKGDKYGEPVHFLKRPILRQTNQ